jgi:hypothetical protein
MKKINKQSLQQTIQQMGQSEMGQSDMGMPQTGMPQMGQPQMGMPQQPQMGMPQMGMPQMGQPQMGQPQMGQPQMGMGGGGGAANGGSYLPDGKTDTFPSAIDTYMMNRQTSQTPVRGAIDPRSAYGSGFNSAMQQPPEEEEFDEVEEEEEDDMDNAEDAMAEGYKSQFRDSIISLLGDSNVSASLVEQLEGVFEAAVQDRVEKNVTIVLEEVDQNVKTYLSNVTNNLVEKVDDYLEYVVEEWMTDNAVAVEQGIKTQIAENFITGLKNLFENHYIDVPAEKYNVLDELYAQNKGLHEQLNHRMNDNINLKKEVALTECAGIFVAETKDLADTQVAKLQALMENVSFGGPEEYRNKLSAIKDSYLNNARQYSAPRIMHEEQTFSKVKEVPTTLVEGYASALGRINKKV